jgi:hypothetical protein
MLNVIKLNLQELKIICFKNKFISYKLEKNYLNYRIEYSSSNFKNCSYLIQDEKKNFCLALIFFDEKKNELNFYGHHSEIFFSGEISNNIIEKFKDNLDILKRTFDVDNINLIIRDENLINNKIFQKFRLISQNNEIMIDLDNSLEEISKNFKPILRNELKKNYNEIRYKIIDKNNYSSQDIIDMKTINENIPTLEKRSLKTWLINEKWILNNEAFLVKIIEKSKTIGFSMFYFNNITCKYFASCIYTKYFKTYKNLQHLAIWKAIQHIKPSCKYFYLGLAVEKSLENINIKEMNIGKFKLKFNKTTEKSFIINL